MDGTVRLFDRGEYYTCHGDDAKFIAQDIYRTDSVIKLLGAKSDNRSKDSEGLPSVTLNPAIARNFLREALTQKQLGVEIWIVDKRSPSGWKLGKRVSLRYHIIAPQLIGAQGLARKLSIGRRSPLCRCRHFGRARRHVGQDCSKRNGQDAWYRICRYFRSSGEYIIGLLDIALIDPKIGVCEFIDNELFSNLEVSCLACLGNSAHGRWQALAIQLGVKEIIIPQEDKALDYEYTKLRQLLDRCSIVVTERKKGDSLQFVSVHLRV